MKLYMIRHGKTEYNQKEIIQGGAVDSPLLSEGVEGAVSVGKALADKNFASVYVSPLGRTRQTADCILQQWKDQPPLILEEGLREMFFGDWDGRPVHAIAQEPEYKNLRHHPKNYDPSNFGGESYRQIVQRGKETLTKIVQNHQENEEVLIVSHGVFITSVARCLTGTAIADLRNQGLVDNTSITRLNVQNGEFFLEAYNEIGHLN